MSWNDLNYHTSSFSRVSFSLFSSILPSVFPIFVSYLLPISLFVLSPSYLYLEFFCLHYEILISTSFWMGHVIVLSTPLNYHDVTNLMHTSHSQSVEICYVAARMLLRRFVPLGLSYVYVTTRPHSCSSLSLSLASLGFCQSVVCFRFSNKQAT